MTDDAPPPPYLRLLEAVKNYCDPKLITALVAAERKLTESEHRRTHRPLFSDVSTLRQPSRDEWMARGAWIPNFDEAWDRLTENFQALIEQGSVELEGVQLKPAASTDRLAIPRDWAAMMRFDLRENTIWTYEAKYGSIRVYRKRPVQPEGAPAAPSAAIPFVTDSAGKIALAPGDVALLSDDTLLSLLEEHGRRVVGTPDAKLLMPGKVSFLPILRRKLIARSQQGELLSKTAEFQWLADWIASKIDHHQIPTAGTISRVLAKEYDLAKARSTAAIQ